jgi:hypothetical protein
VTASPLNQTLVFLHYSQLLRHGMQLISADAQAPQHRESSEPQMLPLLTIPEKVKQILFLTRSAERTPGRMRRRNAPGNWFLSAPEVTKSLDGTRHDHFMSSLGLA